MNTAEKYRPSNGTEGEIFKAEFCYRCALCNVHNEDRSPCKIEMATFFYDVDSPKYPPEWQYDADGHPTCTAFKIICQEPEFFYDGPDQLKFFV